jgi:beta-glucosidase
VSSPFFFATGIENSYPIIASGARIDQMEKSGHYDRWQEDFALVHEMGLNALRYGPAYYRAHAAPNRYEFEPWDAPMRRLRDLKIEVIADLCHFGVPSWLGGFQDEAFPVQFAMYARQFAERYPWVRYFTPVNEIFICANFSALRGWWNECEASEATFIRAIRNLCMANELAVEAILDVRPDAIFVQSESIEHFHPSEASALPLAEKMNGLKHLALDLTLGHELAPGIARLLSDHGVPSSDLSFFRQRRAAGQRWLGLDYYATCEHRVAASGETRVADDAFGLHTLAMQYFRRYGIPLFHCETNRIADQAVRWLDEQWSDVLGLMKAGVPVHGFTWYSLTDQIDWQYALRFERNELHPVGLFDLDRRPRPVAQRFREIAERWTASLNDPDDAQARAIA